MKQKKKINKAILTSIILFSAIFILGTVSACSPINKAPKMYIEAAKLTEQEEKITKLLEMDSDRLIYDFKVDDTVQSMQVNSNRDPIRKGNPAGHSGFNYSKCCQRV